MWRIDSWLSQPCSSWARWSSGISADFGRGYRPMISFATDTLASLRRLMRRPPRSSVDVSEDGVDGRDHRDGVGDQAAAHHVRQALDVDERWRADVDPVRAGRAVADEVAPELAPWALDGDVHLTLGHLEALGEQLEVVD